MTGEELRALFAQIAQLGFAHDHDAYLARTNRQFWGIAVNRSVGMHEPLFGDPAGPVLGMQLQVSHAGYSVGAARKPQGESTDILLLATEYLVDDSKSDLRDALLLHEACHLITDAGLPRLKVEGIDRQRASEIRRFLHPDDTLHDVDFLQQLSAATRRTDNTGTAEERLRLAMSVDALFDAGADEDADDDEYPVGD